MAHNILELINYSSGIKPQEPELGIVCRLPQAKGDHQSGQLNAYLASDRLL